jgi:dTDP-6-deoxy-L-talose 4-dehydrogenase (NAD+)
VRPSSIDKASQLKGEVVPFDIADPPEEAFDVIGRPDVLIHLAWEGLPNYMSTRHTEVELATQYRFLSQLVRSGLKSLVVTGTCFEYGMLSGALDESMEVQPDNPYGIAKDTLRKKLEDLKLTVPFNLTWARLFYIHGDGQRGSSLLSQLKQSVERGDSVFNMSGGEQLRDYLPVDQVAKYLVSLAIAGKDFGVINVCSGEPVSIRELVEEWILVNEWSISPNYGYYPYPEYEPHQFWGSKEKLESLLGSSRR